MEMLKKCVAFGAKKKRIAIISVFCFLKAKQRENIALNDLHFEVKTTFKGRTRYQKVAKGSVTSIGLDTHCNYPFERRKQSIKQTPQTEQQ